jgi:membrane-bound lytic murein transglycosylase B
LLAASPSAGLAQAATAESAPLKPAVQKFIADMARMHGFDTRSLQVLFAKARTDPRVIRAVSAPATSRPWYLFKPLCVDDEQIVNGVDFWQRNATVLDRARRDFGVAQEIVVAVIGIENRYGQLEDHFRVLDSLYTLAFEQQLRAGYFKSELEQFLLLAREQAWEADTVQGSFTGALGWPQFMPSSYRRYALDYSGNGKIDLWADTADVVGSVASYLRQAGWKEGNPVVARARVTAVEPKPLLDLGLKPKLTLGEWHQRGVDSVDRIPEVLPASLFALDMIDGPQYWLGFANFYALLQYNYSRNYGMAVYQLAQDIVRERERVAAVERQSWSK